MPEATSGDKLAVLASTSGDKSKVTGKLSTGGDNFATAGFRPTGVAKRHGRYFKGVWRGQHYSSIPRFVMISRTCALRCDSLTARCSNSVWTRGLTVHLGELEFFGGSDCATQPRLSKRSIRR